MLNYFHFRKHNSLVDRFNYEENAEKEDEIIGLKEWRIRIEQLLTSLTVNDSNSKEKKQKEIEEKIELIKELTTGFNNIMRNRLTEFYQKQTNQQLILKILLKELRKYKTFPKHICPRLFISHRKDDTKIALELAIDTTDSDFAYWIDVEDYHLAELESRKEEKEIKEFTPLLTACIIEMALINCTHIVAYLSEKSRGSLWIPYEYGRIKNAKLFFSRACVWDALTLKKRNFPDYMHLGIVCKNKDEVKKWLEEEKICYAHIDCKPEPLNFFGNQNFQDWAKEIIEEIIDERVKAAGQIAWTKMKLPNPPPMKVIKRHRKK